MTVVAGGRENQHYYWRCSCSTRVRTQARGDTLAGPNKVDGPMVAGVSRLDPLRSCLFDGGGRRKRKSALLLALPLR